MARGLVLPVPPHQIPGSSLAALWSSRAQTPGQPAMPALLASAGQTRLDRTADVRLCATCSWSEPQGTLCLPHPTNCPLRSPARRRSWQAPRDHTCVVTLRPSGWFPQSIHASTVAGKGVTPEHGNWRTATGSGHGEQTGSSLALRFPLALPPPLRPMLPWSRPGSTCTAVPR